MIHWDISFVNDNNCMSSWNFMGYTRALDTMRRAEVVALNKSEDGIKMFYDFS